MRRPACPLACAILALALVAPAAAVPWTEDPAVAFTTVTLTRRDGLPQSSVTALATTADGFLWVGTQAGLARFDGVSFELFDHATTPAMADPFVTSLLASPDGSLWIGTRSGLLRRAADGAVVSLTTTDGLPAAYIRSLYLDGQSRLWIGTYGAGLVRASGRGLDPLDREVVPDDAFVRAMADGADGSLWIGTSNGLIRMADDRVTTATRADGMSSDFVRALARDPAGGLWVGTQGGGLLHLADGRFEQVADPELLPPDATVWALLLDPDSRLWIGTESHGAVLLEPRERRFARLDDLPAAAVWSFHRDGDGVTWVGTRAGLTRLAPAAVPTLGRRHGLADDVAHVVLQDRDGGLWVGSDGGLDAWADPQLSPASHRRWLADVAVRTLLEDAAGTIWAGTDRGLWRRDGDAFVAATGHPEIAGAAVTALAADDAGQLWVGTAGNGVHQLCNGLLSNHAEDLPSPVVHAIVLSADGAVWVATEGGLVVIGDAGVRTLRRADGLPSDLVLTLFADRDGTLWVGTAAGLATVVGGAVSAIPPGRLPTSGVVQILADDGGQLWLGTTQGLVRVDPTALRSGNESDLALATFDEGDGMTTSECSGGAQPAATRTSDGRLWFPTAHGVAVLDPARPGPPARPLRPAITRLTADGRTIAPTSPVGLAATTTSVALRFTAPTSLDPAELRFRCRLDGLDTDWVETELREVCYPRLPPGVATFRVQVARRGEPWGAAEAALTLTRALPWWQERRVLAVLALLALAAGLALHFARRGRAAGGRGTVAG